MKPRFTHDCRNCTFVRQYKSYDMYIHVSEESDPVVVARFGDAPEDYASAPMSVALYLGHDQDPGTPYAAYTKLAKQLLSDGVFTVALDPKKYAEIRLTAKGDRLQWNDVYAAFLLLSGTKDEAIAAAIAYCNDSINSHLIPQEYKNVSSDECS